MGDNWASNLVRFVVIGGSAITVLAIGPVQIANTFAEFFVEPMIGTATGIPMASSVEQALLEAGPEFEQWSVKNPIGLVKAQNGELVAEELFEGIDDYGLELSDYSIQYVPEQGSSSDYQLTMSADDDTDKSWVYSSETNLVTVEESEK